MKLKADGIELLQSSDGSIKLTLTVKDYNQKRHAQAEISNISDLNALSVEITPYREKRSLSANSYFWVLVSNIASVIKSDIDSVYLGLLERYGQFTHLLVKPNAVEKIKQQWKTVKVLDEKQINGQKAVQLLCYYGSSTYDSKEMSTLIDGAVYEAKELGIEVRTPDELARLKGYEKQV